MNVARDDPKVLQRHICVAVRLSVLRCEKLDVGGANALNWPENDPAIGDPDNEADIGGDPRATLQQNLSILRLVSNFVFCFEFQT